MEQMGNGESPSALEVRNTFVRHRNVLVSEADFTPLLVDYYLHCRDHELQSSVALDRRFKDLLAAFTLHGASRPRNEVLAWTIRFAEPLSSFFFAGDTELGTVTGRFFTEGVRPGAGNEFYQELKRPGKPLHRSFVDFEGNDAAGAVERYYRQSEQRPCRLFSLEGDRVLLVTAHPDYDEKWFEALDREAVSRLAEEEEVNLLETRVYRWFCGCGHAKILEVLAPVFRQDPDQLFGPEEVLQVNCPRCAARYRVSREALEAFVAGHPPPESAS